MSLERRLHRRRLRQGFYDTADAIKILRRNFAAVAFMHAQHEKSFEEGYDAADRDFQAEMKEQLVRDVQAAQGPL